MTLFGPADLHLMVVDKLQECQAPAAARHKLDHLCAARRNARESWLVMLHGAKAAQIMSGCLVWIAVRS